MSTPCSERTASKVTESVQIGVLDTSVVIDLDHLTAATLPNIATVPSVVLAELGAGIHAATDPIERAHRVDRLQRVSLQFESLPFDEAASQQYALLVAHVIAAGRNPHPRRFDLLIGATAASNQLPLYTRNPKDFEGLENALTVIPV